MRPTARQDLAPNLAAGVVVGMLTAVNALAYAGLIYRGPLAPDLLTGTSALLASAAAGSIVGSLLAECQELMVTPLVSAAVVYALIPAALGGGPLLADPHQAARLVAALCGLISLAAGAVFWLLGRFRLGALARFLPYPVIGGFNAGLGWLLFAGGIALGTDAGPVEAARRALTHPTAAAQVLACLGTGLGLVVATRSFKHWTVVPGGLFAAVLGFHLIRLLRGTSLATAGDAGWLLGPFAAGHVSPLLPLDALALLPPGVPTALLPISLAAVLVGGVTVIMMLSGIEIELNRDIDTNAELRVAGLTTAVAGVFGGIITGPSLATTSLARHMGTRGRLAGLIVGAVCALVLAAGPGALSVLPRFAVAALLIFNGADRLLDRVWFDRRRLPIGEWSVVIAVLAVVMLRGLLAGLAVGLGIALVLFVLEYRLVSVVRLAASGAAHRSSVMHPPAADALLRERGEAIRLLRLQGYLFFLNVTALTDAMPPAGPRFVIVDFRAVAGMDSSAALVLRRAGQIAEQRNYTLIFSGLGPALRVRFAKLGLPVLPPGFTMPPTEDQALQWAETRLLEAAHPPASPTSFAELIAAVFGHPAAPERMAPYVLRAALPAGATLIRQGDASESMSLVTRGEVTVRRERSEGPLVLATAGPGVVMGEIGFCTNVPRTATVVAATETHVETLSRAALAQMEANDPALAMLIHRLISHMLADKLTASTRQRVQDSD